MPASFSDFLGAANLSRIRTVFTNPIPAIQAKLFVSWLFEKVHFPACALFVCFSLPNPFSARAYSTWLLGWQPVCFLCIFIDRRTEADRRRGKRNGIAKRIYCSMLRCWACRVILSSPPDLHTFSTIFHFPFSLYFVYLPLSAANHHPQAKKMGEPKRFEFWPKLSRQFSPQVQAHTAWGKCWQHHQPLKQPSHHSGPILSEPNPYHTIPILSGQISP